MFSDFFFLNALFLKKRKKVWGSPEIQLVVCLRSKANLAFRQFIFCVSVLKFHT